MGNTKGQKYNYCNYTIDSQMVLHYNNVHALQRTAPQAKETTKIGATSSAAAAAAADLLV